jgi:putative CocE/NonD family hydrolase
VTRFGQLTHLPTPKYKGVTAQSIYIPMRDGVQIAIDVILPKDLPADIKIPAIMVMARYWRSFDLRMPAQPGKAPMGPRGTIADFFGTHGYAVVIADARGSGASFGVWQAPFHDQEVADFGEVAEWVIRQPWSNGLIGTTGISYEGTLAEAVALAHPAVKAVIPQGMEFDVYTDVALPGGILNDWFIKEWSHTNDGLDANIVPKAWGMSARLFVKGVKPVDADKSRDQLKQALAQHRANPDVYQNIQALTYRDDRFGDLNLTLDDVSLFNRRAAIERSGVAIFGWGSWYDGAAADTVIRRFMNFSNPQIGVIGAWAHNSESHGSPYGKPKAPPVPDLNTQWHEALSFFEQHLSTPPTQKVLHYFNLGEEQWKSTEVWPPQGSTTQRWYFGDNHSLALNAPQDRSGADTYPIDFEATTGTQNRWHTEDGVTPVIYPDHATIDRRLLTYTSNVLDHDVQITGHPIVTLYVTSTATDGAFFVYLEDIDAAGKVHYLTEGLLRGLHRKVSADVPPYKTAVPYHSFKRKDAAPLIPGTVTELTFGLLPISVWIKKGHRIRVAIAGHDKDNFARIPAEGTPTITVARNAVHGSCLDLPVIQA